MNLSQTCSALEEKEKEIISISEDIALISNLLANVEYNTEQAACFENVAKRMLEKLKIVTEECFVLGQLGEYRQGAQQSKSLETNETMH